MLISPLDQFIIRDFIILSLPIFNNIHFALTNIITYLFLSCLFIIIFYNYTSINENIIEGNLNLNKECINDTIFKIVVSQINKKDQNYFPFILSIFIIILINNLIGMVPYSFSSTSHFILTFYTSFTIVLGTTLIGLNKHNLKFFSLFVPAGCPLPLLPILVLIEFLSYLARNVSLGLRLAANVLAGHMLLNILSGFTFKIMKSGVLFLFLGLLPLLFIIAFSTLELAIAFIQAQVFVVLTCGYIKDSIDLH